MLQKKFEKRIGSGGFGVIFYGKMKDRKKIAIKVLPSNSYQEKREFSNKVSLHAQLGQGRNHGCGPKSWLFVWTHWNEQRREIDARQKDEPKTRDTREMWERR